MISTVSMIFLLIPLMGVSTALPKGTAIRSEPRSEYTVVNGFTWTGQVEAGGPTHSFHGTAEEILAQIQKVNPDFPIETYTGSANETSSLEARSMGNILCDAGNVGRNSKAFVDRLQNEIHYLKTLGGGTAVCGVGAGPGTCVRISCSFNTGIWLCNDNSYYIQPRCDYLADYAINIINKCQIHQHAECWAPNFSSPEPTCQDIDNWLVHGQQFDSDGYNVIVGSDGC